MLGWFVLLNIMCIVANPADINARLKLSYIEAKLQCSKSSSTLLDVDNPHHKQAAIDKFLSQEYSKYCS